MTKFLGLGLKTTKDTFIPRPETELLVRVCLNTMLEGYLSSILDIGTGAGNIAVSLTKKSKACRIVALDNSEAALIVARKNAKYLGVSDRIEFMRSDLFSALAPSGSFDIIVSNPPYIPKWEIETLADNVKDEPRLAIDGGEDGLDFYRRIIKDAPKFLKKKGYLIMEMGYNQLYYVRRLLVEEGNFMDIDVFKDFWGIDRVIRAKLIKRMQPGHG